MQENPENLKTLTDKEFWINYWDNKSGLIETVKQNILFGEKLTKIVHDYSIKSAIEIGGFPGYYALYLKKYHGIESSLLDYVIHPPTLEAILAVNSLSQGSIHVYEEDLFSFHNVYKYDLVCSFGLIEHFEDVKWIIQNHLKFLNSDGILFITLPNFKGINGWLQKKFDKELLAKHNLKTMDIKFLKDLSEEMNLKVINCSYYGKFTVWLENEKNKTPFANLIKTLIWVLGKLFLNNNKIKSKWFSPYIILEARNLN